jgi:hypothetical protein
MGGRRPTQGEPRGAAATAQSTKEEAARSRACSQTARLPTNHACSSLCVHQAGCGQRRFFGCIPPVVTQLGSWLAAAATCAPLQLAWRLPRARLAGGPAGRGDGHATDAAAAAVAAAAAGGGPATAVGGVWAVSAAAERSWACGVWAKGLRAVRRVRGCGSRLRCVAHAGAAEERMEGKCASGPWLTSSLQLGHTRDARAQSPQH